MLPLPPSPKAASANGWFRPDWQHLSTKGHEVLANGIVHILHSHETNVRSGSKCLGMFGLGGQNFQWFVKVYAPPRPILCADAPPTIGVWDSTFS